MSIQTSRGAVAVVVVVAFLSVIFLAAVTSVRTADKPAPTLSLDGRVGKVIDAQGVVSIKPKMAKRWTPVVGAGPLMPGDWVRTDLRGANAVALRLLGQAEITLGPGSLIEVVGPDRVRVASGEFQVAPDDALPLVLIGTGDKETIVDRKQVLRLEGDELVALEKTPLWLRGFEGSTANESIGSLVAKVDGRDVSLTVGYHKVTVDIRDQIARTVIEESFVNHTAGQLEGVFHFPLPPDASISGFGMWINGELVEADVVEKQRAREIYETILRERRDPGLLEWTGGNIFKARVFPIFGHSEKRIKIVYTQTLPLRDRRYRYSYALRSEMLKQNPLRELAIDVKVDSAAKIGEVKCPTHTARIDATDHTAHVEFTAQEYTPTRDFEVVVGLEGKQSDVTLIPHRRGDDGYFMLQLTPPGEGQWRREVLPDAEPLDVILLADTSASMTREDRETQAQFIGSLLSALTPDDTINLAACDVDCLWAFEERQPATDENVEKARQWLSDRVSLGWTDLDKAFAAVLTRALTRTRVIYVGDGIVTGHSADPVAFGKRLRRAYQGNGELHAVAVSSSFEPQVLKTIGSLGGGSVRFVSGEKGPQAVALELLRELMSPGLRDLKIEFTGLRTARVYPDDLPNLPLGSQQILLGRYLPEGRDQRGEVVVTGMRGDEAIRFSAKVSLKDAESGNSFIPRLWSRLRLDELLEQGSSQAIQDEIVALSEEYRIMTPYTSLLVLETDEDRERFKVKRRFEMRDGERFFAEGRANVDYRLTQKQMRQAGLWRRQMRYGVLSQLADMGRDAGLLNPQQGMNRPMFIGTPRSSAAPVSNYAYYGHARGMSGPVGGGFGGGYDLNGSMSSSFFADFDGLEMKDSRMKSDAFFGEPSIFDDKEMEFDFASGGELRIKESISMRAEISSFDPQPMFEMVGGRRDAVAFNAPMMADEIFARPSRMKARKPQSRAKYYYSDRYGRGWSDPAQYTNWVNGLFPALPVPPSKPDQGDHPWPKEARELAASLLRTEQLFRTDGGLKIEQNSEYYNARYDRLTSLREARAFVSASSWFARSGGPASETIVQFCDEEQRGRLSEAFLLGRLRASTKADLTAPALSLSGSQLTALDETYRAYTASVKQRADDREMLTLVDPNNETAVIRVTVDTSRDVILSIAHRRDGKTTRTDRFKRFAEIDGVWWPRRVERYDGEGRMTSVTTQSFERLSSEDFASESRKLIARRPDVLFLRDPAPSVVQAKRAVADNKATLDDRMTLLLSECERQQWDKAQAQVDEIVRLAADKQGARWIEYEILKISRRHEELKQRLLDEIDGLAASKTIDGDIYRLASHVRNRAAGIVSPSELIVIHDRLKPVYEAMPPHTLALKAWMVQQIGALRSAGQSQEARVMYRRLCEEHPFDHNHHRQYAQFIAAEGAHEAAIEWLEQAIAKEGAKWNESEENALWDTAARLLWNWGDYDKLAPFSEQWVARDFDNTQAYALRLAVLARVDRENESDDLLRRWLREARKKRALTPQVGARTNVAINQMFGQGYAHQYNDRVDERWHKLLAETALFHARHKDNGRFADQIMGNYRFRRTDACREVRRKIAVILVRELDTLRPDRIQRFLGWISSNDPEVEKATWGRIVDGLRVRWETETDDDARNQLGGSLLQAMAHVSSKDDVLAFLRLRREEATEKYRDTYTQGLFSELLNRPWSKETESEAFALLEELSNAEQADDRLRAQVGPLYRLTDAMLRSRTKALTDAIEKKEDLTRTELREKETEALKQAREGLSDRLRAEADKRDSGLMDWMTLERLYLEVLLKRDLDAVERECWELLGSEPRVSKSETDSGRLLDAIAQERQLSTLANLAARSTAESESADRLLAYIDRAFETVADKDTEATIDAFGWRQAKWQLLVALDRPAAIEENLRQWTSEDDPDNCWRRALGYLLAEQGRLKEAIRLFEAIETDDALSAQGYRALAGWYMSVDKRDQHERALVASFKTTDEWQLNNWLYQQLRPWQRREGELPEELDEDVLRVFAALFEKSQNPGNHLSRLREFYKATRDFRLLASLPDAVIGHTAGKVYPFVGQMNSVLNEVRKEAVCDEILEHLEAVRAKATTPVDQRALDMLVLQVERRSAEVINQPGPHAERALAAMRRAFEHEWSDGEPRLMAALLQRLGFISQADLANEQVRLLQVLHEEMSTKGTVDRFHIAHYRVKALWKYGRKNEAVALLTDALREYEEASGGCLPQEANDAIDTLISIHEQATWHARGETILLDYLERPANGQQVYWLRQRLYRMYDHALEHGGDVSLGTGVQLYREVEKMTRGELDTRDDNHRYQLIDRLCHLYRTAHKLKIDGVADDLRAYAFEQAPATFRRQTNNYQSMVSRIADTLHDIAGARDGLAFLIERIENEPTWLRGGNQDGWNQHAYNLGRWRTETKELGDLEGRLLTIVLDELRLFLKTERSRNRSMYYRHHSYYWSEKRADYLRVANEVYAVRSKSSSGVRHVADYVFRGLENYNRAIEMLQQAEAKGVLDTNAQWALVDFLHRRERFEESIELLGTLMARVPGNMNYRVYLMRAYFKTGRAEQLLALLDETDAYFHEGQRWTEGALAALAKSCLDNQLHARSVAYYEELIPLHQRTQPRRGIGNGTLSAYYGQMAGSYAGLKQTTKAVDAACGAVVSWGPTHRNRSHALGALENVLRSAPDLNGYVVELDAQCEESGLENPIVRKALGVVYFERQAYDKSITQLELACAAQPNDGESQRKLIECYDNQGDKAGALERVLAALQLSPRDIGLYKDLGRRYGELDRPEQTERAYTSIVEALPNESESHTMLAEIRQGQKRWEDAIAHWREVARIRTLEPAGLLGLAGAQIDTDRLDDARETIKEVRDADWPPRFNNVSNDARRLEDRIEKKQRAQ